MLFYLGKLAGYFAGPLGLAVILAIVAIFLWRRTRVARILLITGVAILRLFSSRIVSQALLLNLESQITGFTVENAPPQPVIIVLGGFLRSPSATRPRGELTEAGDRLITALRLFRAGKAPLILISGGDVPGLGTSAQTEAEAARVLLLDFGVPDNAILVEKQSKSTAENAAFSRDMLAPRGIKRALLVTSAAHMPRAVGVFRKVGIDVSPVPADFLTGWPQPDWPFQILPDPSALNDSQIALHEYVGLLMYRIRGWL